MLAPKPLARTMHRRKTLSVKGARTLAINFRLASDSVPPPSIFEIHIFFARQDEFYV